MSVLRLDGLTAGYGKTPIVRDLSARVNLGQVVALVGPNGAGKSTALKATFGLLGRVGGRVLLDEEEVAGWPPHRLAREGMAYVPQVENVFPSMSVQENLEIGAFVRDKGVRERIDEVLDIFPDLAKAAGRRAGTLSGGQRNMLGMARALMPDPKVVLLDEPTAGLSPAYVDVVWRQVRRIADQGTAVLVVEQNVDRALRSSDWVYVLVAGTNRLDRAPGDFAGMDLASIFLGGAAIATAPAETEPDAEPAGPSRRVG